MATVEQRLTMLESQVSKLRDEVRAKDWRRTIGAFTNDDGAQQILRDAILLREADRKKRLTKKPANRKKP